MEAHASSDLPGFLSGCLRSEKQTAGDACQHHRGLKAQAQAKPQVAEEPAVAAGEAEVEAAQERGGDQQLREGLGGGGGQGSARGRGGTGGGGGRMCGRARARAR